MKRLKKNKIFKKVFSSVLPLAFLFVTICSGNIAHAADIKIPVLKPDGSDVEDMNLHDTRNFDGTTKNSEGTSDSSKGTIEFTQDASGTLTLILKDMDLTVEGDHTFIDVVPSSTTIDAGVLQIELVGTNKFTLVGEDALFSKIDYAQAFFIGDGTLDIKMDSALFVEGPSACTATGSVTFAQNGTINLSWSGDPNRNYAISIPNFTVKNGTLNINDNSTTQAFWLSCNKFTISNGNLNINQTFGDIGIKTYNFEMTGGAISINSGPGYTNPAGDSGASQNRASLYVTNLFKMEKGSINITSDSIDCACLYLDPTSSSTSSGDEKDNIFVISGGRIDLKLTNPKNTHPAFYFGNKNELVLEDGFISAIGGSASPYGIGGAASAKINIKNAQIEAWGSQGALQTEMITLNPDLVWTALVGDNSGSTTQIHPKTASDLDPYKYVKLSLASTLAPDTSVFNKNITSKERTDITVKLNLNGNKLTGIFLGDTQLTSGKEFIGNINAGSLTLDSVTFKVREFLDSLAVGTHTLTFAFDDGTSADFNLEVVDTAQSSDSTRKDQVPKTGDQSNVMLYVLLLTSGLFSIILANKKKLFNK